MLSATLTAAAIGNLFLLRHLGACIDEREQLKVSGDCSGWLQTWQGL